MTLDGAGAREFPRRHRGLPEYGDVALDQRPVGRSRGCSPVRWPRVWSNSRPSSTAVLVRCEDPSRYTGPGGRVRPPRPRGGGPDIRAPSRHRGRHPQVLMGRAPQRLWSAEDVRVAIGADVLEPALVDYAVRPSGCPWGMGGAGRGGYGIGWGQDPPGYGCVPAGDGREKVRSGGRTRRPGPSVARPGAVRRTRVRAPFPGPGGSRGRSPQGCGRDGCGRGVPRWRLRVVPGCACNRKVLGGGWVQRSAGPGGSW